jgi:hypothetical protein
MVPILWILDDFLPYFVNVHCCAVYTSVAEQHNLDSAKMKNYAAPAPTRKIIRPRLRNICVHAQYRAYCNSSQTYLPAMSGQSDSRQRILHKKIKFIK